MSTSRNWGIVELRGPNRDGEIMRFTIADGASISRGQLLQLTDARTVTAITATRPMIAGPASEEHISGEGTSIGVWQNGIFEVEASGGIRVGEAYVGCPGSFVASGAGVSLASGALSAGMTVLEAADDGEVIEVRFVR